jgi:hypothetical protein
LRSPAAEAAPAAGERKTSRRIRKK